MLRALNKVEMMTAAEIKLIKCPFCGEDDFDLIGLKHHLEREWCEIYNELPATDEQKP
jgi:4-hydroxy-3-methylbut-2-en-1-yl diphosphate synthase IspG/GcpE